LEEPQNTKSFRYDRCPNEFNFVCELCVNLHVPWSCCTYYRMFKYKDFVAVLKSTCHWFEGTRKKQRISEQILYVCSYINVVSKILVSERPTVAKLKKLLNRVIS